MLTSRRTGNSSNAQQLGEAELIIDTRVWDPFPAICMDSSDGSSARISNGLLGLSGSTGSTGSEVVEASRHMHENTTVATSDE